MGSWKKTQAIITLPPGLRQAGAVLQELAFTAQTVAQVLQAALQMLGALTILDLTAAQLIVKAAVGVLEQVVKELLKDTGVYVLFVPVGRRLPIPATTTMEMERLGIAELPYPAVNYNEFGIDISTLPADTVKFLRGVGYAGGGSAGFFNQVVSSTIDPGDPARPQFGPYDYVAGVEIVVGATDFLLLIKLFKQLGALFGPLQKPRPAFQSILPVPSMVSAQVAPTPSGNTGIVVTWSLPRPVVPLGDSGHHAVLTNIIVIRSTDSAFRGVNSYAQAFGADSRPAVGVEGDYGTKIIAVIDINPQSFTSIPDSYVDTAGLVEGQDYYYALAYTGRAGAYETVSLGGGAELPPDGMTSAARVHFERYVPISSNATPPNWIRTPSVMALVPGFHNFLGRITKAVHEWGHTAEGFTAMIAAYVAWLNREIAGYTALAMDVTRRINFLVSLLNSAGAVGIYTRTFQTPAFDISRARGGNIFFLNDLATALSADPSRPPFLLGDEYVAGMVLLAGAPTLEAIQPVIAALNMLIGSGTAQANVVRDAVRIIGDAVTDGERIFDSGFVPWTDGSVGTAGTTGTVAPRPYKPPAPGTRDTTDNRIYGPWDVPPSFPSIGSQDKGNCPLVKKGLTSTPVLFGPDMQLI